MKERWPSSDQTWLKHASKQRLSIWQPEFPPLPSKVHTASDHRHQRHVHTSAAALRSGIKSYSTHVGNGGDAHMRAASMHLNDRIRHFTLTFTSAKNGYACSCHGCVPEEFAEKAVIRLLGLTAHLERQSCSFLRSVGGTSLTVGTR